MVSKAAAKGAKKVIAGIDPIVMAAQAAKELWAMTPEERAKLREEHPEAFVELLKGWKIGYARQEDNPEAFGYFYELVHGKELPRHVLGWVKAIYGARAEDKGVVIEAFRGSTKTTAVTITFTAWRIGKEPHKSNLLIQVGDDIAMDNTSQIADIIKNSLAWKAVFPHIVPDEQQGWGAGGYEVKIDEKYMPYEQWRSVNANRKDPTLLGVGYKSGDIIGKHPDGVLVVDDIHNEINTSSDRELSTVRKILTGTIFPTIVPHETWPVFIGTPWVENDCLSYAVSTDQFVHIKTPVMVDGEYAWPEKFGAQEVESQKAFAGIVEFSRMFLLDLSSSQGINLRNEWLHEYPASQVNPSWPVLFGIDYASTMDRLRDKDRDYFTLAVGRAIPGGGVVLMDGYRGHLSKGEALDLVLGYWALYPTLFRIGVENIGKGEEFYNDLLLTKDLGGKVPPLMAIQHGRRSKGDRFENWLAPRFQASRIWISDVPTPFLNEFRHEWALWPNASHDDCLDAGYMMAFAGEGFLPNKAEWSFRRERKLNPLVAFGRS